MKVRFTTPAAADLEAIYAYLAQQNPGAAQRVKSRIKMDAEMLGDFPFMARSTGKAGVRVLTVTPYPYLIFYTVRNDGVLILHIRHGARRPWQPSD